MAIEQALERTADGFESARRRTRRLFRETRKTLEDIENPGLLVRMGLVVGVLGIVYLFVLTFINGITLAIVPASFPAHGAVATLLAIGATVAFGAVQYVLGKRSALETVDARELSSADAPAIHETVAALSEEMEIEKPDLYTAELGAPNAFAVGRQTDGAVVLGTELLDALDDDEVEGVVAHELAHLKHRDSILMTLVASVRKLSIVLATVVTALTVMVTAATAEALASSSGNDNRGTNTDWERVTAVFVAAISTAVAVFILLFSNALSRYREYIADTTAAKAIGDTTGLENGLETIERYHEDGETQQTEAVSALCIFGDRDGVVANLFATHPSMDARIENLRSIEVGERVQNSDST